jgi:c-di-GMP-binding flagellar brake protein YcgR
MDVKKDTLYSIRMSGSMLQTLKRAAMKDRRTVASLLDKIILDYLEKEGFIQSLYFNAERRRFQRKKVTLPAISVIKSPSKTEALPTVILDISLGGVLVTYPKGTGIEIISMDELPRFELYFKLPQFEEQIHFPCEARRLHKTIDEIQVGATFFNPDERDLRKLKTFLM